MCFWRGGRQQSRKKTRRASLKTLKRCSLAALPSQQCQEKNKAIIIEVLARRGALQYLTRLEKFSEKTLTWCRWWCCGWQSIMWAWAGIHLVGKGAAISGTFSRFIKWDQPCLYTGGYLVNLHTSFRYLFLWKPTWSNSIIVLWKELFFKFLFGEILSFT